MKRELGAGLFSLIFCTLTSAKAPPIDESYFIPQTKPETLRLLSHRPELIIDHVKAGGFELYGPAGLHEFLKKNNIPYSHLDDVHPFIKSEYPTPEAIEKNLKEIARKFPSITRLYSIGKSVQNRDLWVMKLSKNAKTDDQRPEFKYIANMHGDEIVGREVLMLFIKDLTEQYGKDKSITDLLDKTQIHIMVSMNPDGAALQTRGNANRVDLNRDFPDFSTEDNLDIEKGRQPETQAVMKWQKDHRFVLSANFHGGAEVVNYPWDTIPDPFYEEAKVLDISHEYARLAPYIGASTTFENGITNGYAWYEVNGGMQDWSIHYRKDFQITVELSNKKWPDYSSINYYYEQNRPALIKLIERVENQL